MAIIFGKRIFEKKATLSLYDFAQHGILGSPAGYGIDYGVFELATASLAQPESSSSKKKIVKKEAPKPTPKELYTLKTLNQPEFAINCDLLYLAEELDTLKLKQEILGKPSKMRARTSEGSSTVVFGGGQVGYGKQEIASMIERLVNRRQYKANEKFFSEYPYTTNDAVRELLNKQKHLEAKFAAGTIPDLPRETVKAIKDYTEATMNLCGKKPVFYLIAEKKANEGVQRRRDPILLAQSPFGFFWQILGAWDKEIVFLDEL